MTVFLDGSWWKIKSVPARPHCLSLIMMLSHLVLHGLVDPVDQPGEGLPVDGFGQGISGVDGVVDCERTEDLYKRDKIKGKVQAVHENTTINKPQVILTHVPDRTGLRSSCTSVPLGGCEHQLLTASGKR